MKMLAEFIKLLMICSLAGAICGCAAQTAQVIEKPDVALRRDFPNLSFDSVEQTDIKGLYEVVSGTNIFYFYPEKDYVFAGEIYTKEGKSLTAEKKGELAAKLVKNLPLDKAVKSGEGKTTVVEFTDPDCHFCKRAYEFFKTRKDVTLYTFFSPLAHPAAISKVYFILNSKDRSKAYHDVYDGKSVTPPAEGYSESIKNLAREHLDLARSVGVSGTPTFFINGNEVVGADIQRIEGLLDGASGKDQKNPGNSDQK